MSWNWYKSTSISNQFWMQQMVQCDACMGSGKKTEHACNTCNSSGTKTIEDSIELNIPAGITDGAPLV